ncbi:MAG: YceI family protein [Chlorobi bacterium]|nr:YceI family protein [Chlorobiota bacterium]
MKTYFILFSLLLSFTIAYPQKSGQVKLFCDKEHSSISYSMNHPLHSWTGINKEVRSIILFNNETISQVAVAVTIASFDSQNANRDSHAIEVTEAIKYPTISFSSDSIKQNGNKLNVTGTLNFHGVNKIISFETTIKKMKNKIEATGEFTVLMTEFNIKPPSLMGMATDDNIKIKFDIIYLM